jgi:hypothetical protein
MRHGIAGEAHPAQHQENADRRRSERDRDAADERPAHELELGEGGDEEVVRVHVGLSFPFPACGERASRRRARGKRGAAERG